MKKIGKSVNSSQGLTDHRRLMSKLLPILRLAVTFFLCTSEAGSWPDDLWDLQVSEM